MYREELFRQLKNAFFDCFLTVGTHFNWCINGWSNVLLPVCNDMWLTCTAVTSAVNKSMWRSELASVSFISSINSSVKPGHRAPRWINIIGATFFYFAKDALLLRAHRTAAGKTPRRAGAPRSGMSSGRFPCRTQPAAAGRCFLWSPVTHSGTDA